MKRADCKSILAWRFDPALFLLCLSASLLWFVAIIVLQYYAEAIIAPGPNTVGEAGKVFFAQRFAMGESIFASGLEPPYYPSVHGVLVHAIPGSIGLVLGADTITYYYIGRSLSVGFTIATFIVTVRILRDLQLSDLWIIAVLLLFLAERDISIHTVSYRPDNWLLFYSTLSCFLLLEDRRTKGTLAALTVLPVLAFFTKASGLSLLACTVASLFMLRRMRDAWRVGAGAVLLIAAVGSGLQIVSGGRFLSAFGVGAGVGFSLGQSLRFFRDPLLVFVTVAPTLALVGHFRGESQAREPVAVILVFWFVSLLAAAVAATRAGSSSYYLLEPYYYGSILLAFWADGRLSSTTGKRSRLGSMALLLSVSLLAFVTHVSLSGKPDIALLETYLYGDERQHVARAANNSHEPVFSSDPGLNVLLDQPAVIHPYVQTSLIQGGKLSRETLLEPVRRRRYRRMYLIPEAADHVGFVKLPDEFYQAVWDAYCPVPHDGDYLLLEPRQTHCPTLD